MRYPGFINGSFPAQAVTLDQERTVNLYLERSESPGATSQSALYPTPGVEEIFTADVTGGRANFFDSSTQRQFVVIGTSFIEMNQSGLESFRGSVAIGTNPATISSNGSGGGQLFVTSGDNGYLFDLGTNNFQQIVALDGKATMGDHLDGYFLALDAVSSTLYISNLLQGLTWVTGVDFAQRSIAPDPWVSMKVLGRYIWLLGTETSEVWYNTGANFPFAPHPSGLIQYGCAAPFSVGIADATIVWLGATKYGHGMVLRAGGFTPEVISTQPLQKEFNGYTTISDAIAYTYNDLGHTFYMLTFDSENHTWAWDAQTNLWAERGTWISEENRYVAWRPRWHAMAYGEHRMLDNNTGTLYRMSTSIATDVEGRLIRWLRRAPALMSENQRISYPCFELDLEPGLGLTNGQGSDPQVMMRMSNDGGKTWGTEQMRSAGKTGEYGKRVRWNRCGQGRRRVFEVSGTDSIRWRLTNAYLPGVHVAGRAIRAPQEQQAGAA